jgi:peptide/nickel transport system substrate-binding protein
MFKTYEQGKTIVLVRNPNWDPATDPNRKALSDEYDLTLGMNADDVDKQLEAGTLDVDLAGTGVQTAALSTVLGDPNLKAQADNRRSHQTIVANIARLGCR